MGVLLCIGFSRLTAPGGTSGVWQGRVGILVFFLTWEQMLPVSHTQGGVCCGVSECGFYSAEELSVLCVFGLCPQFLAQLLNPSASPEQWQETWSLLNGDRVLIGTH